jgi:hypothetical protein
MDRVFVLLHFQLESKVLGLVAWLAGSGPEHIVW